MPRECARPPRDLCRGPEAPAFATARYDSRPSMDPPSSFSSAFSRSVAISWALPCGMRPSSSEVEADRAAPTNLLHRDMVDRQSSPRGNEKHALQKGLVVERKRCCGDREIRIGERTAGCVAHGFTDRTHALDRRTRAQRRCRLRREFPLRAARNLMCSMDSTPGTRPMIRSSRSAIPCGALSRSVSIVLRASRNPAIAMKPATPNAANVSPCGYP